MGVAKMNIRNMAGIEKFEENLWGGFLFRDKNVFRNFGISKNGLSKDEQ